MSTKLIAHLKKKCEEDGNVAILYAQWEFDQKLVGKALENIGGFYPHFSNHNASHSQQILVNIERILGDDVDLLSATDTWLILEAAYWHDVGMLVDAQNAKEVHTNPDFNFMIQTIANEKGHDLQKFCQAYVANNWLSAIGTLDHPFDGVEKYRQLIAEWFRRGHDKRIGKLVEDPFKDLGITSPRTELLPNRIYSYLGQICVSHGMNFSTLMETLPYKQTGLGTENCHPRFIGCLLRLGDLFDLDDNRFCPVMAKHVSNMPSVSKHHHDKHLSLREFQLDKRTVKLVAECPDEMSYVETQNWFGWIREEFQNQMSQWNLIVPNLQYGALPTIEQLEVRMQIESINGLKREKILLNNKPMKFTLDEKNGMELLQGANLYKNELSIFRELIQNSIDATMIRIWLEEDQENIKQLNPYHEDFLSICARYAISIDIQEIENSIWEITIKDKGIGISLNDLNYIQKMAGSNRNLDKIKIINSMPLWMKPSGEFGIGLHSAFLLSKELEEKHRFIKFKTMSYFSNDLLEIEMNSPLGEKGGYCFIQKTENAKRIVGTELKVRFISSLNLARNFLNIHAKSKDYNLGKILFYKDIINKYILENTSFSAKGKNSYIWDYERNLAYKFSVNKEFSDSTASFRGQTAFIDSHRIRNQILNFNFDYYGISASDTLNVSRDIWKEDFIKIISNDFDELSKEYTKKTEGTEKYFIDKLMKYDIYDSNRWQDYEIEFENKKISFKNLFKKNILLLESSISNFIDINPKLSKNLDFYLMSFGLNRLLSYFFRNQMDSLLKEIKIYETNSLKINDEDVYDVDFIYISVNGDLPPNEILGISIDNWELISKNNNFSYNYGVSETLRDMVNRVIFKIKSDEAVYFIKDNIFLKRYKDLVTISDNEAVIVSPYQVINNKIELMDLEFLTNFIIDNKGYDELFREKLVSDFSNLLLDIKLIVNEDKLNKYFKETPH